MLSTTQVGDLAGCSRFTVERACRDEEIAAKKVGRNWVIEDEEGRRWAGQYRPHARTGRTGKKASAAPGKEAGPAAETTPADSGKRA